MAQLQKIGLDVEVKRFPFLVFNARLGDPDEPWDLATLGWLPDYRDPAVYLNALFEGGSQANISHFDSRRFNRRLQRQAGSRGRTDIARTDDSTSISRAWQHRRSRSTT